MNRHEKRWSGNDGARYGYLVNECGLTPDEALGVMRVNDKQDGIARRGTKGGPTYKKPSLPSAPKQVSSLPGQMSLFA